MDDLEAAADKAELTGQIRSFMAWLGEGRKLTQTGRIGLADARHLVKVLGTGDKIDPEIGDLVSKTKSSEELPHLTRIVVSPGVRGKPIGSTARLGSEECRTE